ncbi:L-aminoadipate-semialdehyde dehydrogenase-phosphopantetheinyl transferase [Papilio machaon]|uniref:L-aminoadipate-semialdehyde dehydrogenase-phosphopantetheinyl transferase n=1 Tax=Papilio machaon TaxID=76193 RepID=A0A0N1INT7_PAPMA|nr:L-aminoadipate-semialdehyde dehydrogenase-phosphopantetheinyl transferase [Papilio machaon]
MAFENVRWAFNVCEWKPSKEELLAASSYIQPEEKDRIARFIFQDDAKSSLIGRLLMKKFVHLSANIPYELIKLGRDDTGKPYLLESKVLPSFNVSHQGDYTVLAGNLHTNVGVDIMKIEPPVNKNIPDFFRIMNRQFSRHEWSTIRSYPSEMQQVACFYRMWCLKESYVKNIGIGITIPLDLISFSVQTPLKVNGIVTDTKLYLNNVLRDDWIFEETLLDEKHAVAVSLNTVGNYVTMEPQPFTLLSFEDLVREARPVYQSDARFTEDMLIKKVKEFRTTGH